MKLEELNKCVSAARRETEATESAALEQEHRQGYASNPQTPEEINEWAAEQVWDSYESD